MIGVFNGAETIGDQLEGLAGQNPERLLEVVVADNGSTDGTVAVAESYAERFSRLVIVDAADARGVSHARNAGAERARGAIATRWARSSASRAATVVTLLD